MPYDFTTEKQVTEFFRSTRHVRGTILRARYVGPMPALMQGEHVLLPSHEIWDFLIRTPEKKFIVVRGGPHDYGQPYGGSALAPAYRRRQDAETMFGKLLTWPVDVPENRGGGVLHDGMHKEVAFIEQRGATEFAVTDKNGLPFYGDGLFRGDAAARDWVIGTGRYPKEKK